MGGGVAKKYILIASWNEPERLCFSFFQGGGEEVGQSLWEMFKKSTFMNTPVVNCNKNISSDIFACSIKKKLKDEGNF